MNGFLAWHWRDSDPSERPTTQVGKPCTRLVDHLGYHVTWTDVNESELCLCMEAMEKLQCISSVFLLMWANDTIYDHVWYEGILWKVLMKIGLYPKSTFSPGFVFRTSITAESDCLCECLGFKNFITIVALNHLTANSPSSNQSQASRHIYSSTLTAHIWHIVSLEATVWSRIWYINKSFILLTQLSNDNHNAKDITINLTSK